MLVYCRKTEYVFNRLEFTHSEQGFVATRSEFANDGPGNAFG